MKNGVVVEYSSNNSGGSWWLKDEDWEALENVGWKVIWVSKFSPLYKEGYHVYGKDGLPKFKNAPWDRFVGVDGRYLGALAREAYKVFPDIQTALREFERVTGQTVTDEGCNCCGAPHSFHWWKQIDAKDGKHVKQEYGSGEDLLAYLYPDRKIPGSLREALDS